MHRGHGPPTLAATGGSDNFADVWRDAPMRVWPASKLAAVRARELARAAARREWQIAHARDRQAMLVVDEADEAAQN